MVPVKSDARIQQDVLQALRWNPQVESTNVGVEVDEGIVTLTGTVHSSAERLAAQEAAHRVFGVQDVANDLHVRPLDGLVRTNSNLARAVRHTLVSDVVVPDLQISSTVSDGWVTLDGTVGNWHEREQAEQAVRHLAGVRGVINRLEIKEPSLTSVEDLPWVETAA
jgi:osmotically-inducible protein OsmY